LMAFLLVCSAFLGGGIPKADAAVATWSNVQEVPPNTTFTEVVYGDGVWFLFASNGNWWELTGDSMSKLTTSTLLCQVRSALYVEDEWIAGCVNGKIYVSTDKGSTWNEKQTALNMTNISFEGIAYDGSETVVLAGRSGQVGGTSGAIVTSDVRDNWVISKQGEIQFWDVTNGEGKFIAVGQETGKGVIYSSIDGEEWNKVSISQPPTILRGVAYGYGKFVAVGYEDTVGKIYVSEDGETWEEESPPAIAMLSSVTFGAGKFYAAGANRLVISSVDGLIWEIENTVSGAGAFSQVAAIDGRAYAIGSNLLQTSAVQSPVDDTTPPELSGVNYSDITQTNATITATSNEDATLYYVITTSPTAPTKAQVISGQDETGVAAIKSGNSAATANTAKEFQVTGLTPETQYYVYFVARDSSNNASDVSHTSFTTSAVPKPANAMNNSVTANPTSVTLGASIILTATGDRQAANGTVIGDEQYVPVDWTSDDGAAGTFSLNGSDYTSTYTPTGAGTRTVTATFKKNTWNGTVWNDSGSSDTKTVTLTVNALVNAETPRITTQPADQTVNVGGNATLNVSASVTDGGTLSYKWYSNSTKSNSGGTAISDAESSTFSAPTTSVGTTYYYVEVTNTNTGATGSRTATATSNPAEVNVNSLVNAETPRITTQPADKTVNVGGNATLSVTASISDGGTLSYQWYSNTTNSNSGGTTISGAESSTFAAPTTSVGTTYYYVEVTNTNTGATGSQTATETSNPAAVNVNSLVNAETPRITTQPADKTVNVGSNATLSVTASVTDGGILSYQWYSNTTNSNSGGTAIGGTNSSTFAAPTTSVGTTYYYVVVTNTNTSVTGIQTATATSNPATVTVNRPAEPTLREIISVTNPHSITGVANGTPKEADALGLPKTVEVTLDNGSKPDIEVKWDVASTDYNPKDKDEQNFTVTGELVRLPNGIYNNRNLGASVRVSVDAASIGDIVQVENPGDISGLPNGTPKKAEALGLPEQVRVTLEDGTKLKVSVKWDVSRSEYDPTSEEAQSFTVTGELMKLPEGVTNSQKLKASVRVQVKAADDGGEDGRKIVKVTQPAPITGVENGTRKTAKALGLPEEVKVTLDDGSTLRVEVKWDVEDADYDPDSRKKQRFTVNGELVDLPDDVENPKHFGVSIRVTVDAAERDDDRDDDRDNRRNGGRDDQSDKNKTRFVKVEAGDDNGRSLSLQLEVTRKTSAGGKQVDEVEFDKKKAKEILEKAEENNKDVIRITIDDLPNAPADEVLVKLPESTLELIQDRQVALVIKTGGVIITIPREIVADLPQKDLYFRIVPIRQRSEEQAVAQRTLNAEEVKQAAGGQSVLIVGKPMVIETNYSNRRTKVTFPLQDVQLPTEPGALRTFLTSLSVYVEHSDGDKELKTGEIVYDQHGKPVGIEIEITKFSTFTILSLQGKQEQVVHTAYMTGYPDGTFQPNRNMTRAEVAAVIASLMQEAGQQQEIETTASFADVPTSHWAAKAIQQVQSAGLMKGNGNGLFQPHEKVTRGEMAAILVKMKELSTLGKSVSFGDTQGHWAQASIDIAVEHGMMKGYADGSFRPNQGMTRAEGATLINRLTGRGPLIGITKAIWSDVPLTHWAFAEIAEATQSHTAMKLVDGTEEITEKQ